MSSSSSLLLPDTLNKAWARDKSRFGFAMLAKMGWQEGKGLGRNEDGMTTNIRVTKRTDALGIGAAPAGSGGEAALTAAVSDYNALLASLSSSAVGTSDAAAAVVSGGGGGRIIARFARRGVLRQKNVAAYSAADLAAVLGTAVVGGRGGAGVAVALPDAPELRVVHRSERERKNHKKKRAREEEKEAEEEEEEEDIKHEVVSKKSKKGRVVPLPVVDDEEVEAEAEDVQVNASTEDDDDAILRRAAKKWAKRAAKAAAEASKASR